MTLFAYLTQPRRTARQQHGAATLVVSITLLFGMTLIAFFANKNIIFEQKTSANQMRSTKAFEAAEAGIEWATSMLNDPRYINASCTVTGINTQSFRSQYLPYSADSGFVPVLNTQPGCTMNSATGSPVLSCSCPAAGSSPILSSTIHPTFTVKFKPVNAAALLGGTPKNESVLVTASGCTAADGRCVPGFTGTADAYQEISVLLKLRPALKAVPAAAISTGGSVVLGSSASTIANTDVMSNGTLVNAGGTCCGSQKFQSTVTLPGTPVQNAIVTGDASLSDLSANQDAMFNAFFGTTVAQYQADPATKVLTTAMCGGDCATAFQTAFDQGYRAFYLQGDMSISNGTIGTSANPVILVTSADLKFNGSTQVWGLIYADTAISWNPNGLGSGGLNGALVTRSSFSPNANANYLYDADVLSRIRGLTGTMMRVPGSWKDF